MKKKIARATLASNDTKKGSTDRQRERFQAAVDKASDDACTPVEKLPITGIMRYVLGNGSYDPLEALLEDLAHSIEVFRCALETGNVLDEAAERFAWTLHRKAEAARVLYERRGPLKPTPRSTRAALAKLRAKGISSTAVPEVESVQ